MMRRVLSVTAMTLALAACAGDQPMAPAAPAPTSAPAPAPASPPAPPPSASTPAPPASPRDACGAAEAQGLVGRPRTEIPIPLHPALQRVACTTCPVTQDFNPRRLNFFFDAASGLVREVKCG